jgi:hypothetical protein
MQSDIQTTTLFLDTLIGQQNYKVELRPKPIFNVLTNKGSNILLPTSKLIGTAFGHILLGRFTYFG